MTGAFGGGMPPVFVPDFLPAFWFDVCAIRSYFLMGGGCTGLAGGTCPVSGRGSGIGGNGGWADFGTSLPFPWTFEFPSSWEEPTEGRFLPLKVMIKSTPNINKMHEALLSHVVTLAQKRFSSDSTCVEYRLSSQASCALPAQTPV